MDEFEQILKTFEQSDAPLNERLKDTIFKLIRCADQVPHPGEGATYKRWQMLAKVAKTNLNLVKWFESHLDALSILHELNYKGLCNLDTKSSLWAVWAAEGSSQPLKVNHGQCTGIKNWCSGAESVNYALMTFKDTTQQSQLVMVDVNQKGVHIDDSGWQSIGMQHTGTASLTFDNVAVDFVGESNAYLDRPGFWHGAAGVAACWYGSTVRLADYLIQATQQKPNDYRYLYLGEVFSALATTQTMFKSVAAQIDLAPRVSHEFNIRVLRAQVEKTANLVLNCVGKALGARPFCEDAVFAQHAADLPVFLRQSHAAFDLKSIAELGLKEARVWDL